MTDVGVVLGVKIALSVGKMQITHVGVAESKHFDLSGSAVDDVNAAEKWAEPGSIILSRLAYLNCNQSLFLFEIMDDGFHYRVSYLRMMIQFKIWVISYVSIRVILTIGYITNSQWLALQLAWLAQWIERCVRSSQRLGFYSRSRMNFFWFFCNSLGFSLYCDDHVYFQIFTPSLECDSFQFLVCLERLLVLPVHWLYADKLVMASF